MVKIVIPQDNENLKALKHLVQHAYKTSRVVFAKSGFVAPVLLCEVEETPDGKSKRGLVVTNVPSKDKYRAAKFLKDKVKQMKPLRYAFVSEAWTSTVPITKENEHKPPPEEIMTRKPSEDPNRGEIIMCEGRDKFGNSYFIHAQIIKDGGNVKKLGEESESETGFVHSIWDGIFDA